MCSDGSMCFIADHRCGNGVECNDGSDESDIYSQCNYCTEEGYHPCPGFPGNCGKLCDGAPTCPDRWDELLSVCKSHAGANQSNGSVVSICSEEAGLHQCEDGSMCLRNEQICDGEKHCADGSDENSDACKDKCSYLNLFYRFDCDNDSCIHRYVTCSAPNQPFCKDGSDMDSSLCNSKCYTTFPSKEDPYMFPCVNGTKKCILQTYRCDGVSDCDDSSDEYDCPLVTNIGLHHELMLCLALIAVLWLIFYSLAAFSESSQDSILDVSNSDPTANFVCFSHLVVWLFNHDQVNGCEFLFRKLRFKVPPRPFLLPTYSMT